MGEKLQVELRRTASLTYLANVSRFTIAGMHKSVWLPKWSQLLPLQHFQSPYMLLYAAIAAQSPAVGVPQYSDS